jgi:hypothetical protein
MTGIIGLPESCSPERDILSVPHERDMNTIKVMKKGRIFILKL